VLSDRCVGYLDLTGSENETAAHVAENVRIPSASLRRLPTCRYNASLAGVRRKQRCPYIRFGKPESCVSRSQ
jgi:hypothetical protein